jgi:hypothetical protein
MIVAFLDSWKQVGCSMSLESRMERNGSLNNVCLLVDMRAVFVVPMPVAIEEISLQKFAIERIANSPCRP